MSSNLTPSVDPELQRLVRKSQKAQRRANRRARKIREYHAQHRGPYITVQLVHRSEPSGLTPDPKGTGR